MLFTLLLLLAAAAVLWLASLVLKDAGIVDIFWGPGVVCAALASVWWVKSIDLRGVLIVAIVTIWGLRLGGHLALRWWRSDGEDRRYTAIRKRGGWRFLLQGLFTVFLLQALVLWFVSLPVQTALMAPQAPLNGLDLVGAVVALAGFLMEAVADRQLRHFKIDSANQGRVLDTGLWAWSRHPNYFGDAMFWWGLFLIAWAAGSPRWVILSPILMTYLLIQVSGVKLLESDIAERRPDYADYIRRTSAFVPMPPKRRVVSSPELPQH